MHMKHWAHLGIALTVVNATLLGGVRAAELNQTPWASHQPGFGFLRSRLSGLWRKPPKEMVTPVTIRLFSSEKLGGVWFKNSAGFVLSGRSVKGTIFVRLHEGKLWVYSGRHLDFTTDKLAVSALD